MATESREFHPDEQGDLHVTPDSSISTMKKNNWIERVVWNQLDPNPNLERSNTEHREISYQALAETDSHYGRVGRLRDEFQSAFLVSSLLADTVKCQTFLR